MLYAIICRRVYDYVYDTLSSVAMIFIISHANKIYMGTLRFDNIWKLTDFDEYFSFIIMIHIDNIKTISLAFDTLH